jgi:hypothetical protein
MLVWTDRVNGPHFISCCYGDKYQTRCILKPLFSEEQIASALAAAPDQAQGDEASMPTDRDNEIVSYSLDELRFDNPITTKYR